VTEGLRILFVATQLSGGIASSIAVLIRELARRGAKIGVHALRGDTSQLEAHCALGATIGGRRRLLWRLATERWDLCHATAFAAAHPAVGPILRVAAARMPIVCTAHSGLTTDVHGFPARAYTAVSKSAAAALLGVPHGIEVELVANAPDTELFRPGAEAKLAGALPLLWVGRTMDRDWYAKDVLGFLYFAAAMQSGAYELILVDETDRAEELGVTPWLKDRVRYRASLRPPEMAALYREVAARGGAWVSTSRAEGLPMTLLEAWASGCPAVVPNISAFERVRDGENGIVYDRAGGIEALVRALARLPELRGRIREGGLAIIRDELQPARIAEQYAELYARVS
jgi:glycosyltransferase involved in cell wall biosynthesis